MNVRYGVRLISAIYLALGLVGFLPVEGINPIHHDGVGATYLLHLVAVNTLHNIVHFLIGATGLVAARSTSASATWSLVCGPVLLLLFAVGMAKAFAEGFPVDQSLLGLVPLNSPGHILHLVTGGLALYLGLMARQRPVAHAQATA